MFKLNKEDDSLMIGSEKFVPFIPEDKIKERTAELAGELREEYKDKLPIFIAILNGSFIFFSDLIREVTINCEIDFLKLSSYGDSKISSGDVKMLKGLNADVTDRHVVVVEDIVDSGLSLKYMQELIGERNPASLKVVSLLYKPGNIKHDVTVDYVGFEIPDKFVIGYGLDYAQKYRNLKSIYVIDE